MIVKMLVGSAVPLSSGDITLDRRIDWARGLMTRGDTEGAIGLLRETIDGAPGFLGAWYLLADSLERTGARDEAVDAYRRVVTLDPEDKLGASLRLARLERRRPEGMPPAYVRALFDQNATRFEADLVETLAYRGPELLRAAVEAAAKARGKRGRFARVLDLGCGTGLMGAAIRDLADELVGVDLSPGMIMQAQTKDVYDRLVVGNLVAFLEEEPGPFDLVLAADVFVYLEDLKPIISLVRDKLAPGGLLAFTTEAYRGDGVILNQGLRFAHGEKHLREAAKTARLDVFLIERASARTAEGKPVPGSIAVMARRAAQARRSVRRPTRRARSAAQSRRNTSAANSPVRSASSAVPRP
jgi:predicted TPR repeat methyltransferase